MAGEAASVAEAVRRGRVAAALRLRRVAGAVRLAQSRLNRVFKTPPLPLRRKASKPPPPRSLRRRRSYRPRMPAPMRTTRCWSTAAPAVDWVNPPTTKPGVNR